MSPLGNSWLPGVLFGVPTITPVERVFVTIVSNDLMHDGPEGSYVKTSFSSVVVIVHAISKASSCNVFPCMQHISFVDSSLSDVRPGVPTTIPLSRLYVTTVSKDLVQEP